MSTYDESAITVRNATLPFSGMRAVLLEVLLIAAAVVLPVLAHLAHLPVRFLLPMHWPVIVAGLVYGWRGGALTGLFAPVVSYLFSGFPVPNILPSMMAELLTYGLVIGVLREKVGLNSFLSVAIALVLGRIVFVGFVLLTNGITANLTEYLQAALPPGLVAAVCQVILLPLFASWWIGQERGKNKSLREKAR